MALHALNTHLLNTINPYTEMKTLLQAANEYSESFNTGSFFERIRVESFVKGYEFAQQQLSDKDKEIKELTGKVEFYRVEMSKLREYCETNKIGKPNQKLLDAIYDHLESKDLSGKPINFPATQKNKELRVALAEKDKEIAELRETFEEFKRGIAEGAELYANMTVDDQEFTPYQSFNDQKNTALRGLLPQMP